MKASATYFVLDIPRPKHGPWTQATAQARVQANKAHTAQVRALEDWMKVQGIQREHRTRADALTTVAKAAKAFPGIAFSVCEACSLNMW